MGDIERSERWTIWSLPGTIGQRVVVVDGRVPDARERIEVVPASALAGAVDALREIATFTDDELGHGGALCMRNVAERALDHRGGW